MSLITRPRKDASEIMITRNRIPCKRIELELWLWAIKDSCGSYTLNLFSMWLTIDEVLLNYSVISPERVTLLEHCTSSHYMTIV
jgi:hypothetical protein